MTSHKRRQAISKKDDLFLDSKTSLSKFEFNQEVAKVFDDMVSRSVPFYHEIHAMIQDMAQKYMPIPNSGKPRIYDLGCSTGSTFLLIDQALQSKKLSPHYIGIDNSPSMLKQCEKKIKKKIANFDLICGDIEKIKLRPCEMVIMNYTLQFIPPRNRITLLQSIYTALKKGGILIMSEKILLDNPLLQNITTDLYYDFKRRNGYSELEISRKREALENVLIPWQPKKHLKNLHKAGFTNSDMLFRWYNFASFVGIK